MRESGARWSYHLLPAADGATTVVQRRTVPDGVPAAADLLGMRTGLARVRELVERG